MIIILFVHLKQQVLMDQLLKRDPRETSLISPLQLLERQLDRVYEKA